MGRIQHGFDPQTDRYAFDFGACSYAWGWAQIDTYQDASYFGVWTNPEQRRIFTYAEGDLTLEECETDADYRASLVRCLNAYSQGSVGRPAMIDVMTLPLDHPTRDRLVAIGLAGRLH